MRKGLNKIAPEPERVMTCFILHFSPNTCIHSIFTQRPVLQTPWAALAPASAQEPARRWHISSSTLYCLHAPACRLSVLWSGSNGALVLFHRTLFGYFLQLPAPHPDLCWPLLQIPKVWAPLGLSSQGSRRHLPALKLQLYIVSPAVKQTVNLRWSRPPCRKWAGPFQTY